MTVKLLKQSILGQRHDPLMVSLDDTGYYYTRHWNISSTMFVMLLRFVLCVLLRFRKNTQLATVGTHYQRGCTDVRMMTSTKHVPLWACFRCSLSGASWVGEEDAEHPKHAPMGMFWVFGVRGRTRKTTNTKNTPPGRVFHVCHEGQNEVAAEHEGSWGVCAWW